MPVFLIIPEVWGVYLEHENFYDLLWQVWQKEKVSNELQDVSKEFYDDVIDFLASVTGDDEHSKTTKENTVKLIYNIFELRKKKVLLYIAYKKPMPQSIPKLDMSLYNQISDIYNKTELKLDSDRNNFIALQQIPKIILPSGTQVGPLSKDDIISIKDEDDKNFLLKNNICKKI